MPRHKGFMGRSDIPFAQRLKLQRQAEIVAYREETARVTMFCNAVALHQVEGIGYKRLVKYSLHFKKINDEFYADPVVGMEHAKRRMEYMGMPISGELFTVDPIGRTKRDLELDNNALQASQVAQVCAAIAMNDEFGFAQKRQERVSEKARDLADRYSKEGIGFLLEELEKIGFLIVNGEVRGFLDENENPVTAKKAKMEGFNDQ